MLRLLSPLSWPSSYTATLILLAACSVTANAADVVLQENGDTVTLSNGILTARITQSKARIDGLQYRGFEMLRDGYFSMDGGRNYRTPAGCRFSIKVRSPEIVDIGVRQTWHNEPQAFDIDVHYVLRRDGS